LKDRQTASAIQNGEHPSAEELLIAIEKARRAARLFHHPFLLAGEGKFSWRRSSVVPQRLGGL